jgi:hypothetical protein
MASWIRVNATLTADPKVLAMGDHLLRQPSFLCWALPGLDGVTPRNVTRNVTAGVTLTALLRVWGLANEVGKPDGEDLLLSHCTIATLDEIGGVPFFGEAMASVGWAIEERDGSGHPCVRLPKFLRNNTPAESRQREANRERQRRFRERRREGAPENGHDKEEKPAPKRNVTVTLHRNVREEESREESLSCSEASKDASRAEALLVFPVAGKEKEWPLSREHLAEWEMAYPGIDVLAECRRALAWVNANPAKKKTAKGMPRFLVSWLGRSQDSGRAAPRSTSAPQQPPAAPVIPSRPQRAPGDVDKISALLSAAKGGTNGKA